VSRELLSRLKMTAYIIEIYIIREIFQIATESLNNPIRKGNSKVIRLILLFIILNEMKITTIFIMIRSMSV